MSFSFTFFLLNPRVPQKLYIDRLNALYARGLYHSWRISGLMNPNLLQWATRRPAWFLPGERHNFYYIRQWTNQFSVLKRDSLKLRPSVPLLARWKQHEKPMKNCIPIEGIWKIAIWPRSICNIVCKLCETRDLTCCCRLNVCVPNKFVFCSSSAQCDDTWEGGAFGR